MSLIINEVSENNAYADINIPIYMQFHSKRSRDEYQRLIIEQLRVGAFTLFGLLEFLGRSLQENSGNAVEMADFLAVIGCIGKGYQEAVEQTEMDFDTDRVVIECYNEAAQKWEVKTQAEQMEPEQIEAEETAKRFGHSQDLSEDNEPYQLFAALINHPKISIENQGAIFNFIVNNSILSPDDIKEIATVTGIKYELEPVVLDLSNQTTAEDECIDLAKHLSAVLKHPQLPNKLYELLHTELVQMDQPDSSFDSVDYISMVLCQEEKK